MADYRVPTRLCIPDPGTVVEEARAQRGPIVAGWLRAGVARRRIPRDGHASRRAAALLPLAAGYFLSYLFRNVNGVVAGDIMHDLGIGADALGLLTSVYFLAFAAAQLPVGVLLDRHGPRDVQCILLLCAAAGAALCALSRGFMGLLLGRVLIGLGTAGGLMAGLKASNQWFPRERLAMVNGAFIMCGGVGALAATWPAEFLLRAVDWRGLSAVLAAAAVAVAFAIRGTVPRLSSAPALVEPQAPGFQELTLRDIARDPMFRRFAPLSASCFGTVLAVQGLWAGPWLADVEGLSRPEVASGLACMAVALIVAAPCWGMLTQRLRPRMRLTSVAAAAALALIAAEALIVSRPVLLTALPSALPWSLFALFGGMSVLSYSVLADHFPASAIGRANGALNMLHIGGSFAVQLAFGQVIALWPRAAGHYPAHAYQAGLLLPVTLQLAALLWFAWPRRAPVAGDLPA